MTLMITQEEHERFCQHQKRAHNIGDNNRTRISPERETLILHAILEDKSSKAIKREFRTSDPTIAKIKKRHGLWGA